MQTSPDQQLGLLDFWNIIWRRKLMIILLFIVFVSTTLLVSLKLPNYYRSSAMIIALAPESGGLGAALAANPLGAITGSLGGLSTPADRILVFLKSRTVAEMVIKRFNLVRVFNENKWDASRDAWKDPSKPPLMEDAVRKLGKSVTTFKKNRDSTITITVEWKDPVLAADITNYYITALTDFMKNKSVNTTVQIVDPAIPAERKSSPTIRLNLEVAGIMSLFIGTMIAVYLEKKSKKN
jgi:succinoglycan biosynthesis transport protein ExoP